jgi:hypothetical protein
MHRVVTAAATDETLQGDDNSRDSGRGAGHALLLVALLTTASALEEGKEDRNEAMAV